MFTKPQPSSKVVDSLYRIRPLRILYGVSSVGLGHARRSLAIVQKLRELNPGIEIQLDWLTAEPALTFLQKEHERVLEVSSKLESMSSIFESNTTKGKIGDMSKVASDCEDAAKRNYAFIRPFLQNYDLLIQDEFVETLFSFMWEKVIPPFQPYPKTVVLTDYVEFDTGSSNPVSRLKIINANRMLKKAYLNQQLRIFLDSDDALPESTGARRWVAENFHVLGPVIQPPPSESRDELTRKLFGQVESVRFIVFTIGGTAIGKGLVNFLIKNANFLSERLDAYLVVLIGPRIKASDFEIESRRITLVPFTLEATKYFKIAECVVSQAGGSSLYEIASLGVPCVIIPIENHFEQEQNAERFASRFDFEILDYKELSIVSLQKAITRVLKAEKYDPIAPTRGAENAAKLIYNLVGL